MTTPDEIDRKLAEMEQDPYADLDASRCYWLALKHANGAGDYPGAWPAFEQKLAEHEAEQRLRRQRGRRAGGDDL